MYLLQEMKMEIDPVRGGRMDNEEWVIYDRAKEEFQERLGEFREGVALIEDIFRLTDDLTTEYLEVNKISCHAGCSYCCQQMVCCTTLEMYLIVRYIKSRPKPIRRSIKQKVKKEALKFNRFWHRNKANFLAFSDSIVVKMGIERWKDIDQPLREAYREKPCLFLNKDLCSIYPVRPVDCRSAKTKDDICGTRINKSAKGPKQVRLFFDQIASDLIMGEEQRVYKNLQVVPLIGWPLDERFSDFFLGKK